MRGRGAVIMVGRPSNRDARFEQVMQALLRSVARFGFDGASLTQIAQEAGLSRPLVRHHLGNRDDMMMALQDYVLRGFSGQTHALIKALPARGRGVALVDLLFAPDTSTSPDLVLVFATFTARAVEDIALRVQCRACVQEFEAAIASALRADYVGPIDRVAHGITALYFNATSLAPLDMPESWVETARETAFALLATLEDRTCPEIAC